MSRHHPAIAGSIVQAEALAKLAIARGGVLDEYSVDVYLERLARFDGAIVARACAELSDEPRREYEQALPEVGRIIARVDALQQADAEQARIAKLLPAPKHIADEPVFFCHQCCDEPNAWRPFWCVGMGTGRHADVSPRALGMTVHACGRLDSHSHHAYVERCGCSDVNPVIRKHRERANNLRQKKAAGDRR